MSNLSNITFWLSDNSDDEIDSLNTLNRLLRPTGAVASLENAKIEEEDIGYCLHIQFDENEVQKKISRNAGKPRIKLSSGQVDLDMIKKRIKNETAESVAHDLGISRRTLFRRIKEAEEEGTDFFI